MIFYGIFNDGSGRKEPSLKVRIPRRFSTDMSLKVVSNLSTIAPFLPFIFPSFTPHPHCKDQRLVPLAKTNAPRRSRPGPSATHKDQRSASPATCAACDLLAAPFVNKVPACTCELLFRINYIQILKRNYVLTTYNIRGKEGRKCRQ